MIFSTFQVRCRPSKNIPRNLVHPKIAKYLRSTSNFVQSREKGVKLHGKKEKKKMAMCLAQEIVGV